MGCVQELFKHAGEILGMKVSNTRNPAAILAHTSNLRIQHEHQLLTTCKLFTPAGRCNLKIRLKTCQNLKHKITVLKEIFGMSEVKMEKEKLATKTVHSVVIGKEVAILGTPSWEVTEAIATQILNDTKITLPPSLLHILKSKACRYAIKFNDPLTPAQC